MLESGKTPVFCPLQIDTALCKLLRIARAALLLGVVVDCSASMPKYAPFPTEYLNVFFASMKGTVGLDLYLLVVKRVHHHHSSRCSPACCQG